MFSKIFSLICDLVPFTVANFLMSFQHSTIDKERLRVCNRWISCAEEMARITKHVHAKELVEFLRSNASIVSPTNDGFQIIKYAPELEIPLVVLLPEDSHLRGLWKNHFDFTDGALACFMIHKKEKFVYLCLKGQVPTSDLSKGIILLHEAKHAFHYKKVSNPGSRTPIEMYKEEVEVLEFEGRLLELYFGPDFNFFIDDEVERIRELSLKTPFKTVSQSWFDHSEVLFAQRFKEPEDSVEKSLFRTLLEFVIVFRLIDRYGGGDLDPLTLKIQFLDHRA